MFKELLITSMLAGIAFFCGMVYGIAAKQEQENQMQQHVTELAYHLNQPAEYEQESIQPKYANFTRD